MKLSISNIAWTSEQDSDVYALMQKYGYRGLEIAPTRIFQERPYDSLIQAETWAKSLKETLGFEIPSMQSIWFGRSEKLFGTNEEQDSLISYTKKAIHFASAIGCKNLVFGCPKNRNFPENADWNDGIAFFKQIGDYAYSKGTVIGMEANPSIYGTNYINDTASALDLIKSVNSKGFLLNLDVGTMVQNQEHLQVLDKNMGFINHVHVSEPHLRPLEKRKLHSTLANILNNNHYQGYVSIEMGCQQDMQVLEECMAYIKEIFGDGN